MPHPHFLNPCPHPQLLRGKQQHQESVIITSNDFQICIKQKAETEIILAETISTLQYQRIQSKIAVLQRSKSVKDNPKIKNLTVFMLKTNCERERERERVYVCLTEEGLLV